MSKDKFIEIRVCDEDGNPWLELNGDEVITKLPYEDYLILRHAALSSYSNSEMTDEQKIEAYFSEALKSHAMKAIKEKEAELKEKNKKNNTTPE
tara:strand:+ start:2222 stop:2503 length:282 start_codon:yes stop_codon:yes gene_type:complete